MTNPAGGIASESLGGTSKEISIAIDDQPRAEGPSTVLTPIQDGELCNSSADCDPSRQQPYTKLQVASEREIRCIMVVFNAFVILSIASTVVTIVLCNTVYSRIVDPPLPEPLLFQHHKVGTRFPLPLFPLKSPSVRKCPRECYKRQALTRGGGKGCGWCKFGNASLNAGPSQWQAAKLPPGLYVYARKVNMTVAVVSRTYIRTSHSFSIVLSVVFVVLGILFFVSLAGRRRSQVTHEQVWVLILIFVASFYFNTIYAVARLIELARQSSDRDFPEWFSRLDEVNTVLRDVFFTTFLYFFIWSSFHSFRIRCSSQQLDWGFYAPKIIILIPYSVYKGLSAVLMNMHLSVVPMLSAPTIGFFFRQYNIWGYLRVELLYCAGASAFEALLVGVIIREALKARRIMKSAPLVRNDTMRVSFGFYSCVTCMFSVVFIALQTIMMLAIPSGLAVVTVVSWIGALSIESSRYHATGPALLIAGYVLVIAYAHLPSSSLGFLKGWLTCPDDEDLWTKRICSIFPSCFASHDIGTDSQSRVTIATCLVNDGKPGDVNTIQQQVGNPISYRSREPADSLCLKSDCFTMQTHVILFNFAWYVYYYGTSKLCTLRPVANLFPFDFRVAAHVTCKKTDTQALVVDCSDRIIVTFKGTSSLRNLKASFRVNREHLENVVPISANAENETMKLRKLGGIDYTNARIHKGFACAYKSVGDEIVELVQQLRMERRRPVLVTGHSLGGALATICSLDLWLQLDISSREILVSTFGSPRIGNKGFASMYDQVVATHWRIVVASDLIVKYPKVGYVHVGKEVVLTPHGEMIIDGCARGQRGWEEERGSLAHHRKASYLLAIRAWCARMYGTSYMPMFWPFPIRPGDQGRFECDFDEGDEGLD